MKTYKTNISTYRIVKEPTDIPKVRMHNSNDVAEYARNFYHEDIEIYESFFLVTLNRANITEAYVKISQGGTAGTVVDIKIICKYAIDSLASGCILIHNHPSGNKQPSESDIQFTKKVKESLKLMDIEVLDSLIITKNSYYSMADEGII